MNDKHISGLKYPIRIKVFDEDKMHDIHTYAIDDYKDNKFISSNKDMEFCIRDCHYLIIYGANFEQIIKDVAEKFYEKGLKNGKKQNIKKNYKVNNVKEQDNL